MPAYRSSIFSRDRHMSGARGLWRATGLKDEDFGKPFIAVVNSFTEFVPGHIHLRDVGRIIADEIWKAGGVAREFNTIALDDGIAMGHDGMLYSLPSREIITDSIEYMINGHRVDAMVCVSNCDKITPGMLNAAMRLNIPTIFVSGGPMESGRAVVDGKLQKVDLVTSIVQGARPDASDVQVAAVENAACPTCGSCSGMFTANSMNCLTEALGLALPGNGTMLATHVLRRELFEAAGYNIVDLARQYYEQGDESVLPRAIASRRAFINAMSVDIAMGGSTNTILHLLAAAHEGGIEFSLQDIDRLSRQVPHLCKVSPASELYHLEDVHRAGGVMAILGELQRHGLIDDSCPTVHSATLKDALRRWDIDQTEETETFKFYQAAPGGQRTIQGYSQDNVYPELDFDRKAGCIRDCDHAYSQEGGLAVLYGNLAPQGCIVKTAAVPAAMYRFSGPARVFDSQEAVVAGVLGRQVQPGEVIIVRYEGPRGGPGMQEMLYPTTFLKSMKLDQTCALITDGRFSGGSAGLSIGHVSPEAAEGGLIALVENGDEIEIDIPNRRISLRVSDGVLRQRRLHMLGKGQAAWQPAGRQRHVPTSLKLYAATVSNASKGAVRDLSQLHGVPAAADALSREQVPQVL